MQKQFRIFLIAIVLWLGLFSGNYTVVNTGIYPPLFISMLGYIVAFKKMLLPKYAMFFIVVAFIYICLFLISNLYNGFELDLFLIEFRYVLKALLIPVGVSLVALFIFRKYYFDSYKISQIVFWIIFFQATLAVLQLSHSAFREWFFSFLQLAEGWQHFVNIGHFRTIGLAGLSIYDTSLAYSLLFGLTTYLYKKSGYINNIQWVLTFVIFFLLTILSGRTGLILILLLTFYILINRSNIITLFNFLILGSISFGLLTYYINFDELLIFINFAFEFFNSDSGKLESASTNDLLENHLFLPFNVNPIFGDAMWAQPSISNTYRYEYSTDSGYILSFISLGITGFLMSLYMTYIVFKGYSYSYFVHFKNSYSSLFFKIIMFFLVIGMILKGPIFFSDKFMPVLIFVFMIHHYLKGVPTIEKFNTNSNI
jgi:hypothetical protein